MDNNGQSRYLPYDQDGPAYPHWQQQFPQHPHSSYLQRPPESQNSSQPRIEVVIPTHAQSLYQPASANPQLQYQSQSPQHRYQPPPQPYYQASPIQQQFHYRPPPEYRQPPPQPLYNYDHFVPQASPQYFPMDQQLHQPQVNGHSRMDPTPSSPDPLQNGFHQQPQPRQSTQQPPPQPAPEPEPDYAVLLLSLAEEYFSAAKKLKSRSEEYHQLIATGLGCLESVLTNFNLEPLREAQISLQYAQTLFDETENYDDAEKILTKAIEICERNSYLDLKYSSQLLLTCVLFQSKPKAAIKDLQSLIEDAKDYKHVAWGYALRYQLVTFYLSNLTVRDPQQAIQQLEKLHDIASRSGDKAVATFAASIEALMHLQSSHQDAVQSAQTVLATARSSPMDPIVANVPQLSFITEIVDLCCSIRESNIEQGDEKRKRLHKVFGALLEDETWKNEGSLISIPVSQTSLRGLALQKGGLIQQSMGKHVIQFSWLDLDEAEIVGFLLSAVSRTRKNASDRDKVQQFIDGGLKGVREQLEIGADNSTPDGMEKQDRMRLLECYLLVEQTFLHCSPGNWEAARKTIKEVNKAISSLDASLPKSLICVVKYIQAIIEQGTGNLDGALAIYQSPDLNLTQFQRTTINGSTTITTTTQPPSSRSSADFESLRNISLLAAMNTLLIINSPSHPSQPLIPHLLSQLNTLIKSTTDKNILAAHKLVEQQVSHRGIVNSKNELVSALNAAKAIANTQITALVLMVMQQNFFRGQTDEHANKCVRAAAVNVRQWGDPMWGYVAAGVERESLEFRGLKEEVLRLEGEMKRRLGSVPEGVRGRLGGGGGG